MQVAALLVALAGAASAAWGHRADSALGFYAGVMLLIAALGPLAFAAGRDRWPAPLLRLCNVITLCLVALLVIELCWATAEAVKRALPEPAPRPIFSYAEGRADPDALVRWRRHAASEFRTGAFVGEDPHGVNPFVLEPNSEATSLQSPIRINSLGFRGPEISQDKGEAFRIIALGESTTFGYTLFADDEPWPRVLERLIREELGCAAPVEVVNGGVPGWTLANQLRRLWFDILPLAPDLVISYHGYNGFHYLFNELPSMLVKDPPQEAVRPSRLLALLENHLARRRFLSRYAGARELARNVPDVDLESSGYTRRYRQIARRLAARGIPFAVATFNMAINDESPEDVVRFYEQTFPDVRARMLANRMHTKLVLTVSLGKNVLPIDTRAGLDGAFEHLYIDAAHLTQAGRDRLARNLLEGLRELLLRSPRMRCNLKQRS